MEIAHRGRDRPRRYRTSRSAFVSQSRSTCWTRVWSGVPCRRIEMVLRRCTACQFAHVRRHGCHRRARRRKRPGVGKHPRGRTWLDADALSRHRLAGIFTLAILVTLGGLSGAMLSSSRNTSTLPAWGRTAVLVLALVALGACLWTAYVGGRLRHSELRQTRSSLNRPVFTA